MYRRYFKRPSDIVLSTLAIGLLSPIFIVLSIIVLVKHGRPILFSQERPGKNEQIFKMYKFRTMSNETDSNGVLLSDDERLTNFGRFMRSTSLDELPELLNIVKGEMSFVGPRPLLIEYLPYYKPEEKIRHSIRPGLTGLAQIKGRNLASWDERLGNDVKYAESITFLGDLSILLRTIKKVIRKEDIVVGKDHIMKKLHEERSRN